PLYTSDQESADDAADEKGGRPWCHSDAGRADCSMCEHVMPPGGRLMTRGSSGYHARVPRSSRAERSKDFEIRNSGSETTVDTQVTPMSKRSEWERRLDGASELLTRPSTRARLTRRAYTERRHLTPGSPRRLLASGRRTPCCPSARDPCPR